MPPKRRGTGEEAEELVDKCRRGAEEESSLRSVRVILRAGKTFSGSVCGQWGSGGSGQWAVQR